jgi:predicted MarR family transcription regulator
MTGTGPVRKAAKRKQSGVAAPTAPAGAPPAEERAFIVSSSHLATPGNEDLSEFEFALTVVNHAFQRWVVRGMAVAGLPDLSPLDALILHSVHHRGRRKSISDLMFTLNLSERHYLNYAMKKLDALGLITRTRAGKEVFVSATEKGRRVCEDYARIRKACLLELVPSDRRAGGTAIAEVAKALRVLTGLYEQASRSAVSL